MKAAFLLLVCLPFMFAKTVNEPDFAALEAYNRMSPEEKMSGEFRFTYIMFI
jgi:hypothetical protein